MYEVITLKCRCGDSQLGGAPELDIAEFLRCATANGWRRIDEDPVKIVTSRDGAEIELAGTCARCDRRSWLDSWLRRAANVREKFQKAG